MIEHTLIRPQQSYMFRLIAKSSKLPERCRIISDRLLAQLGRGKLKGARQINVNHSMVCIITLRSWKAFALIFLFSSRRSTTSL